MQISINQFYLDWIYLTHLNLENGLYLIGVFSKEKWRNETPTSKPTVQGINFRIRFPARKLTATES